jgi:hypothetical protein
MQRVSLPELGLRIALTALVSLAIVPAAAADDGLLVPGDPTALVATVIDPAVVEVPVVDPAAIVATVTEAVPLPAPTPLPQAVPAAAAEPISALEPQPTPVGTPPPPSQPAAPPKLVAPDPYASPEPLAPPPAPQPAAVAEAQYQPAPTQYQAPDPTPASVESAPPAESAQSGSNADCATVFDWNQDENCVGLATVLPNSDAQTLPQYQDGFTQYHPVNVGYLIRLALPGDNGQAMLPAVLAPAAVEPLVATVESAVESVLAPVVPLSSPASAPTAGPGAAAGPARGADPPQPERAARRAAIPSVVLARGPTAKISSPWTPRAATPRRVQPKQEVHRSHPSHRRLTRHPLPPLRGPVIPVSSSGAAPLGGADGGGSHPSLLLVPFALALVDSVRRMVRDAAPPVVRERDERRERPG